MGSIRPFAPDDIPAVVALRRKAFQHSAHPTAEALSDYLEEVFFRNPWRDAALGSLVYVDAQGRIVGFLGVVPRQATFQGQPIRVAVGTQLMVDRDARGLASFELMKAFLSGPQDLAFSDVANDLSRRMWEALGGGPSLLQSLHWTQPLRRGRFYTGLLAQRLRVRGLGWGLRPLSWAVDALAGGWASAHGLEEVPLTPTLMAAHLPELLGHVKLRPRYDEGSLRWLLDHLVTTGRRGELHRVAVRSADGAARSQRRRAPLFVPPRVATAARRPGGSRRAGALVGPRGKRRAPFARWSVGTRPVPPPRSAGCRPPRRCLPLAARRGVVDVLLARRRAPSRCRHMLPRRRTLVR